jgi:hypothetical protein
MPDSDRLDAEVQLWTAVFGYGGAELAWSSLVSTMLRDPDFWMY